MRSLNSLLFCLCLFPTCTIGPIFCEDFPPIVNSEKSQESLMPAEEAARTAKLPKGFEMTVFAAEPQVQNPIGMTTDERGRLWIAENYSWAGGQAGGFDATQRDRIIILEDRDGDGRHDQRTVFFDQLNKLTSVEVGGGGVWVLALPKLYFIPDENRDDVPDGPPQVVLDGFDEGVIGHNAANGLRWGPDGWLYGRHGIQATSSLGKPGSSDSQRTKINTGVWRYDPRHGVVEAVMHGMTNAWGFDFDQHGEMFVINTVIGHLWHVVYGAHVRRMYGVGLNPHTYQLIEQTADHFHWDTGENWSAVRKGMTQTTDEAGGGHAHIGLLIYQGDNWPEEYRHRLYTLNLHGLRINSNRLERQGAGYVGKRAPDFCFMKDTWFRGMEMITGPDGGVYIADWTDTGECHEHDGVHRTSGRIYKLTYGRPKGVVGIDLAKSADQELVRFLKHPNAWWPRMARRILTDRYGRENGSEAYRRVLIDLKDLDAKSTVVTERLRVMETLHAIGGGDDAWMRAKLKAPDEHERVAALRFLVDRFSPNGAAPSQDLLQQMQELAISDPSGLVDLHLASALQRIPILDRFPIAEALALKSEFADDRMFPLMLWYGIEEAVPKDPSRSIQLAFSTSIPKLAENIARRLTLDLESSPAPVEALIDRLSDPKSKNVKSVLAGMSLALQGWQKVAPPSNWKRVSAALQGKHPTEFSKEIQSLNIVFGDGRAIDDLRKMVEDVSADPTIRRQSLRALLAVRPDSYEKTLFKLVGDRVMVSEAVRGLALYEHPDTPTEILNRSKSFGPLERSEMIDTLVSRPSYARALLEAVREKKIASNEITAFHARQIRSFDDESLIRELKELWGDVRVSPEEKRALIERYRSELTSEAIGKADRSQGRALFQKQCANCHVLYGIGRKQGPDLTGSNRKNLEYLLENIVDPSASVGADFRTLVVLLESGQVINGVVSEQNDRTITLQTAQDPVVLDRKAIVQMKPTSNSLMPDGLLQNLDIKQIRELFAYLMSTEQVALPK